MSNRYTTYRVMKFILLVSLAIFLSFSVISTADINFIDFKKHEREYKKGEILVKFKETSSDYSIMNTIEILGGKTIKKAGTPDYHLIKLERGKKIEQAVAEYQKMPDVEYAQPNYIYRPLSTPRVPNDTYYSQLWGLKNTGQTINDPTYNKNNPGLPGMDMDLELTWDHVTDCSSIVIAVIDTGVNYDHEDLTGNMWDGVVNHGYDFLDDDNDPMDLSGHGTHVAGTIGAVGNNSTGTTGVCWDVQIMAVRVMTTLGGTTADIISGIYYAADNGAQVLNMSFGGSNYDQAEYDAINYARDNNVIVIAAAGNDSLDNDKDSHHYPSDFDLDNIICVVALDQSYEVADWSNFGSTSVDVGAPGTNILSELCGTETVLTPSLSSGWSEGGTNGWAYGTIDLGYGNMDCLVDPWNWGPPSWGLYGSNSQDTIWRTYNLNGNNAAILRYLIWVDVESNDTFYCVCDDVDGDPFFNPYVLAAWTGSTEGYFYIDEWLIPDSYLTSSCTIGFGLWSNPTVEENGVSITSVSISAISLNNNSYKVQQGTSMATPHVSGLAALIWAFNPEYTYSEVIESIKNGGELVTSLSNKTVTGKAVNAWGSLNYIKPPSGITITYELKNEDNNDNGDDIDDIPPQIISSELSADNSYVDIVFSESVYSTSYGSGALETSDFLISFTQNGGTAIGVFIGSLSDTSNGNLNGGETVVRMHLNIDGIPSGVETVEITPAGGNSIYDYSGNPAIETETTGQLTLNEENGFQIEIGLITITDPTETVNQSADIPTYVVSAYAEDSEGNRVIDGTPIYWRDLNQNASPQAAATGTTNGVAMVTFDLDTLAGTQYIFQADDDGDFLQGVNDISPTMTTVPGVSAIVVLSSGESVNVSADTHSRDVTATVTDGSVSLNLVSDGTSVDWTLTNGAAPWSLSTANTSTVNGQTTITVTTGTSTTVNSTNTVTGTAVGGENPSGSTVITVIEGALEYFGIEAIATPQETREAFNLVMTARDQYDNTVTGFVGTVNISDSTGTITPITSEAFEVGTRTESVTIMMAQADVQITVVDSVSTKSGISNLFDVDPFILSFYDSGQNLGDSSGVGVDLVDLDGDGDIDAFVSNSDSNKVWVNNGSGTFTDSGQSLGDSYSHNADLGDLDGDGDIDAFVANYISGPNKVWVNNGSGVFTDSGQSLGDSSSIDVDLGDLDGDGDLDAFVANAASKVWLNNGGGSFTDSGQSLGNSTSWSVECIDVDNDGDLDAIVANSGSNEVWLNDGSGNFTDSNQSLGNSESLGVDIGDLDGDGDIDAFFSNSYQPNKVWFNNGSGTYTDSGQNLGSSDSYCIELGDLDGDGDLDAFVANYEGQPEGQPNKVWVNDGSGVFTDNGQSLGNSSSVGVDLGDVDGDGDIDAFTANHFSQPDKVWLNE